MHRCTTFLSKIALLAVHLNRFLTKYPPNCKHLHLIVAMPPGATTGGQSNAPNDLFVGIAVAGFKSIPVYFGGVESIAPGSPRDRDSVASWRHH